MARRGAAAREGTRRETVQAVLDSWAVLAWLHGEDPARTSVRRLLKHAEQGTRTLMMCVVNLGEVYTGVIRGRSLAAAEETREALRQAPIQMVPVREPLAWRAGKLKASYALSYADAFAAALALEQEAILYSGDADFAPLEKGEGLKVGWLTRED